MTNSAVGAGFTHTASYGGSAYHADDSGTQNDWLVSPSIDIPADAVSATFASTSAMTYCSWYGSSSMGVSTDGGATWDEGASLPCSGTFTEHTIDLAAYAGQSVVVGIHYTGDYNHSAAFSDDKLFISSNGSTKILSMYLLNIENFCSNSIFH